ncbi:MAG: penicillin acylase family protein [Alphaproteobacteria bacterium]|nr:penicillin acylase family protein [Alphaproteobacteria bacterium]
MTEAAPNRVPRRRRLLRRIAAVLLLSAGAAIAGVSFWAWRTLPQTGGERVVPGLSAPVEVWRDRYGVPHIFADSLHDAWFALGYVHAQDRMWQMEFTRRLGAGRLAEVMGEPALDADRFFRTLGLYRLAEAQAESLSAQARGALDSYASGINAWLDHRAAALPPEFTLLGYEPEPWRPADSLVWGRLLAYQLSTNWTTELLRARLALRLPKALLVELWPTGPPDSPVTIDASGRAAATGFDRPTGFLAPTPGWLDSRGASNAWVIGASRSASGAPILANDPHLELAVPSQWYLARLVTPERELAGATAPGVPFTVLGHNGSVAWGMTSMGGDTQDLFVETLDPADPARYLTPEGPLPFVTRRQTILVSDSDPVTLTVRATRHGPVISDFLADMDAVAGMNAVIALASMSEAAGDATAEALAAMPLARDAAAFADAAANFEAPALNIFFADTQGAIGMVAPGRIPVRRRGDGSLPARGADGLQDWVGSIPRDERPRVLNPASDILFNANNKLVDESYSWFIARDWEEPHRARRVAEILAARPRHSAEDMPALQADVLSAAARDLLPIMLEQVGRVDGDAARAVEMLRIWDLRMRRDRPEPLIYAAWLRETVRGMAEDELGLHFPRYWGSRPRFVRAVLTRNRHWCGDARSGVERDCGPVLRSALERALERVASRLGHDIAGWRWGDLHRATFRHRTLGEIPVLSWLADLSIPSDGGDHTVNMGAVAAGNTAAPFRHIHGAGYRGIYDLSDLAASRYMMPPGQSGNPFSRHYRDLLEPWRDGVYIRIAGSREEIAAAGYRRLVLTPGGR